MESSIFYPLDERPPGDLSPWSLRSRGLRSPGNATATTCCLPLLLDVPYLVLSRCFHRFLLSRSPLLLRPPRILIPPELLYTNGRFDSAAGRASDSVGGLHCRLPFVHRFSADPFIRGNRFRKKIEIKPDSNHVFRKRTSFETVRDTPGQMVPGKMPADELTAMEW